MRNRLIGNIKNVTKVMLCCVACFVVFGCNLPHTKKLERENSALKISLEQCKQEKLQIEGKIDQQQQTIIECRKNLVEVQRQKEKMEQTIIQLYKKLELAQTQITKYKAEKEKYIKIIKADKAELERMKRLLKQAQEKIKLLDRQIQTLSNKQ